MRKRKTYNTFYQDFFNFIFKKSYKERLQGYNLTLFNKINGLHGYN